MKFDKTGEYLALGDKAGRIIVFQRTKGRKSRVEDFDYFAEYQSHESAYDYLQSHSISEAVNCIEWINNNNSSL
jgi:serine/threonine-protein phosphatase 2A regulatory subunit B